MRFLPRVSLLFCVALVALARPAAAGEIYVGTYTYFLGSRGIYHFHFDPETGKVGPGELAAKTSNPSFLAVRPGGHFLYAVNENDKGAVSAFSIGADGRLTLLNQEPSNGSSPCHVFVDRSGRSALVTNYSSASAGVFAIQKDGRLGKITAFERFTGSSVNRDRQMEPHPHSVYLDASGRYAYICDLGTDQIHGFRFNAAKGTITPDETASGRVKPGSGPRHLAFHPHGNFIYVINEMGETITAFARNPGNGALREFQTVPLLPANFHGWSTSAEIVIHPTGKFLYGSNRGHESVSIFSVAPNGRLTPVGFAPTGGKTPRNIAIDSTGKWLFTENQDSGTMFVFKIDQKTGKLTPTGQKVTVPAPVCAVFL
jgi:6-phosphogluconolactonase